MLDAEFSKQKLKNRYLGIEDPVAKRILDKVS